MAPLATIIRTANVVPNDGVIITHKNGVYRREAPQATYYPPYTTTASNHSPLFSFGVSAAHPFSFTAPVSFPAEGPNAGMFNRGSHSPMAPSYPSPPNNRSLLFPPSSPELASSPKLATSPRPRKRKLTSQTGPKKVSVKKEVPDAQSTRRKEASEKFRTEASDLYNQARNTPKANITSTLSNHVRQQAENWFKNAYPARWKELGGKV